MSVAGKYWKQIYGYFRYVGNSERYITDLTCLLCGERLDNNHGRNAPQPIVCHHLTINHDFVIRYDLDTPAVKICRECKAPLVTGEDQACAECLRYMRSCKDGETEAEHMESIDKNYFKLPFESVDT